MLKRILLYTNTVRKMKPSQIIARIRKSLRLKNTLGIQPAEWDGHVSLFQPVEELDFDPVFISRFDVNAFEKGNVTFLHESEKIDWDGEWGVPTRSALWNFNLHYFEFLMAYVEVYRETNDSRHLDAIKACINGWIEHNPVQSGGDGWAPYTISLRLVYWFSCLYYLSDILDKLFVERMIISIHEQYVYLAGHLEKDLLANHYFEDLKALILCSIAFKDVKMLERSLAEFKNQCREQILSDGMHFELSPMYHKIILESIFRVAVALRGINRVDSEVECYIKPMIDVAYTFEFGLERIPLFNDGGDNIAKSLNALLLTANKHFNLSPEYRSPLHDSGYYFLRSNDWKLIVDAGAAGPKYNAGHAHCDAMSFELFYKGKPVIVNCGTFAYQSCDRAFFRSTTAHNTVMINNTEQSQCWGNFRIGKVSSIIVKNHNQNCIQLELYDYRKQHTTRTIELKNDHFVVSDEIEDGFLQSFYHLLGESFAESSKIISCVGEKEYLHQYYSPEYGVKELIFTLKLSGNKQVIFNMDLQEYQSKEYDDKGKR